MATPLVARSFLERSHIHGFHGFIFRGAYSIRFLADPALAEPLTNRRAVRFCPSSHSKVRTLQRIFHFLFAAVSRHSSRPQRMALVVGLHGLVYCRGLFRSGRDSPVVRGFAHRVSL